MNPTTLSLWGKGSVTLPKQWRDQHPTKNFMAEENDKGYLVIRPIVDVEYYENDDGSFGLRFPGGMEADELLRRWDEASKTVRKERAGKKRTAKQRRS